MQFTGLVIIVTLTMVTSARPVVVNLSSAELVRRDHSGSTCERDGLCIIGRDNGVTKPQNTGTYDGPIERCNLEDDGCANLD
ncbi:hypothetical protein MVEN_01337100 [Mycena venus]|uniref:Uncharacterized protein n=1 Tax=Mycena venus TaxID=2733690 RepID=A0A8H6Y170_9AGAR|nr:hypothetical protein MVEN_01337100 [Mycena venus]